MTLNRPDIIAEIARVLAEANEAEDDDANAERALYAVRRANARDAPTTLA